MKEWEDQEAIQWFWTYASTYNPGQNIWDEKEKLGKNWTGQEKFDIYFCVFFDCYCQGLMSPPKYEIFLIFPDFLRF